MTKYFSLTIAWLCLFILLATPLAALWLLFDLDSLAEIAQRNLSLQIIWESVDRWQLLVLWVVTVVHLAIGLVGLFYLRRSFINFAKGRLFDLSNTKDLRRFSIFIFIQAITTPIYYMLISVLLSWQHPAGQKMLSVIFGSNELRGMFLALIVWVVSSLLVEAEQLRNENQQFV